MIFDYSKELRTTKLKPNSGKPLWHCTPDQMAAARQLRGRREAAGHGGGNGQRASPHQPASVCRGGSCRPYEERDGGGGGDKLKFFF